MAEEVKQRDPRAEVRRRQIEIAKSMKVQPEILDILEKVEEWQNREWLYICALDGLPAEQIRKMQEGKASIGQIRKTRLDFLREQLVRTDPFQDRLEKLQQEVRDVCKESRDTRNAIERGLEDALKKQARAQEETIRTKDQMMEMLTMQVEELNQKLQEQEKQTEKIQTAAEEDRSVRKRKRKTEAETITEPETPAPEVASEEESADAAGQAAEDIHREKKGILSLFASARKDSDTRRFIDRYIKDDSITPEQKEFLLDCLEEGMSIKEIEKFAAPGLSIEVMQRLKNLQMK